MKFNKRTKKLLLAERFRPLLADLYWASNNPNRIGAAPGQVMVSKMDGWEFGCKVDEIGLDTFRRKIFVRPEQPFSTIPPAEKDSVMNVVFDVMLEKGTPPDQIEVIAPNCVLVSQMFVPILLKKTDTAQGHIKVNDGALEETGKMVH